MEYSDPNGEVLSAATRVPLHPAGLYLGIKPEGWAASRSGVRVQVVALDPRGKPLAERAVSMDVYERKVYSYRRRLLGGFYAYDSHDGNEAHRLRLLGRTDARGFFCARSSPSTSARFILLARAKDDAGREASSNASVWVRGDEDWWFEPDEPRPHRSDPGEEALRAGRDREIPGAHAVPRGDGARHGRARRRARRSGS